MPQATPQPISITYHPLDTPAHMAEALDAAIAYGYRGTITAYPYTPPGGEVEVRWQIELNPEAGGRAVEGLFGDCLVWDGMGLAVMAEAEFLAKYTPL